MRSLLRRSSRASCPSEHFRVCQLAYRIASVKVLSASSPPASTFASLMRDFSTLKYSARLKTESFGDRTDNFTNADLHPDSPTAFLMASSSFDFRSWRAFNQWERVFDSAHSFRTVSDQCSSQKAGSAIELSGKNFASLLLRLIFESRRFANILASSTYRMIATPASWPSFTTERLPLLSDPSIRCATFGCQFSTRNALDWSTWFSGFQ
mmetsp:Transcript_18604/g.45657  ORF Transcript_18604/g.45657 Transcript_18604/m.45657 type:complete len:209 (+) Transcript_18604:337-963(+)